MAGAAGSELSRGGMRPRSSVRIATNAGTHMVIASGGVTSVECHRKGRAMHLVFHRGKSGDGAQKMDRRRTRTERHADHRCRCGGGAARSKSLLPAGVVGIDGSFARGDAVIIRAPNGAEVGRGLIAYDIEDALKIRGRSSTDIASIFGFSGRAEMVHRDDLVVSRE